MTEKPAGAPTRTYRSPLREQQTLRTRELILDAFAALVVERGVADATMSAVAHHAQVAERTVYRHFPNGRALLDGLSEQAQAVMHQRRADWLEDVHDGSTSVLADIEGHALSLYEGFAAAGAPMKAAIIASLSHGYRSPSQPGRIDAVRRALRDELPQLSEEELDRAVVMVRFQLGAQAWYLLTEREGMTTTQAARMSARAVRALVDSLRAHPRDG